DDFAQVSEFETGAIFWGYGAGAVPIYGAFYKEWKSSMNDLGYPLTDALPGPTASRVVFCAFGCLFTGGPHTNVHSFFYGGPGCGRSQIVTPDEATIEGAFASMPLPGDVWQLIKKFNPNYFTDLWKGRLVLQAVDAARDQVPVVIEIANVQTFNVTDVYILL